MKRTLPKAAAVALVLAAIGAASWAFVANRRAASWFGGDRATWVALADGVSAAILARGADAGVATGSDRFDGEWDLVTCQMAVIGLSQVALAFPETEATYRPARDRCLGWLVTPEARHFGTVAWGEDGLESARGEPGHAYLGYLDLALGIDRLVRGSSPWAEVHDRLTASLQAGLAAPVHQFQTYPGETYPADLSTVAAAVAVHARATDQPLPDALIDWLPRFRAAAVDPETGWIYQTLDPNGGPSSGPRGSGTAFTAAWMAWADPDFARELYQAHRDLGKRSFLGFGGMREYPPGVGGWGDIDSGPVIFGIGVSPTGFALASARSQGDRTTHRRLYRTTHLFGLPIRGGRQFATGGGIGNAILLAMLTAPASSAPGVSPAPGQDIRPR